jgi:hypothetical protein
MRIAKFAFAAVIVFSLTICAAAQSVADAAKQPKPAKKAAKVYTNDEIPSADISKDAPAAKVADAAKTDDASADKDAKAEAKSADGDKSAEKKEASPDDAKKLEDEWKAKIATQKQKIADNERELQLTDREYKLRSAVFFADAGNRLRDDKKWSDTERKYKEDMARLQQDLSSNKVKLEGLREEARKAGIKAE